MLDTLKITIRLFNYVLHPQVQNKVYYSVTFLHAQLSNLQVQFIISELHVFKMNACEWGQL